MIVCETIFNKNLVWGGFWKLHSRGSSLIGSERDAMENSADANGTFAETNRFWVGNTTKEMVHHLAIVYHFVITLLPTGKYTILETVALKMRISG